jgi:hypothetical protein
MTLLGTLTTATLTACSTVNAGRDRVSTHYPSDLYSNRGVSDLDFVTHQLTDMRLLYCPAETLQARVTAGVCIIDSVQARPQHLEVPISADVTLGEVLKASRVPRLQAWDGVGQPSIRVITKRAILAHDGSREFLNTKVSPGDFIVVLPVD